MKCFLDWKKKQLTVPKYNQQPFKMNSRNNNKKTMTNAAFCKVCKDAGKPEAMYTSHYVKDQPGPNGVVVCPTLLSQHCGYCHNLGHTPTHCPILASIKLEEGIEKRVQQQMLSIADPDGFVIQQKKPRKNQKQAPQAVTQSPILNAKTEFKTHNVFNILKNDEISAKEKREIHMDAEFPSFSQSAGIKKPILSGWACMASKPATMVTKPVARVQQATNATLSETTTGIRLDWFDMSADEMSFDAEFKF